MAFQAQPAPMSRYDVRTIVGGGVKLGVVTALGVTLFALVSRMMGPGTVETLVQLQLIIVGGMLVAYLPAYWVRPTEVDTIAWASLLGLLGALTFTVVDAGLLRPVGLYHWTWDEIGGGSGFWYIPVWWMGATVLAWLGAWISTRALDGSDLAQSRVILAIQTLVMTELLFVVVVLVGLAPFHASVGGLAVALALVLHLPVAKALSRR